MSQILFQMPMALCTNYTHRNTDLFAVVYYVRDGMESKDSGTHEMFATVASIDVVFCLDHYQASDSTDVDDHIHYQSI